MCQRLRPTCFERSTLRKNVLRCTESRSHASFTVIRRFRYSETTAASTASSTLSSFLLASIAKPPLESRFYCKRESHSY
jgi:hypothetical protein